MATDIQFTTGGRTANALAIAIKWWNFGYHDYATLSIMTINDIARFENKRPSDPNVIGRGRVAAATVIAAKTSDNPTGIIATIGGTISAAGDNPIVQAVKAPITIAEFLARLTDVHIWIRVAEIAGGAWLAYLGFRMLSRETLPMKGA